MVEEGVATTTTRTGNPLHRLIISLNKGECEMGEQVIGNIRERFAGRPLRHSRGDPAYAAGG